MQGLLCEIELRREEKDNTLLKEPPQTAKKKTLKEMTFLNKICTRASKF